MKVFVRIGLQDKDELKHFPISNKNDAKGKRTKRLLWCCKIVGHSHYC